MTQALSPHTNFSELQQMAQAIVKSNLFGIKTVDEAVTLMLIAQAEGLHPAAAARDYSIIQGRPALKADAMLARFQNAGGKVSWEKYTDTEVSGSFSHPSSPKPTLITWTLTQATQAGLTGKAVWKQYPRAMLRARVISEGVRTVFPGVAVGVYAVEEVNDFDAKPPTQEVEATVAPKPSSGTTTASPVRPIQSTTSQAPKIADTLVDTPAQSATTINAFENAKKQNIGRDQLNELNALIDASKTWTGKQVSEYMERRFKKKKLGEFTPEEFKILCVAIEIYTPAQVAAPPQPGDFDYVEGTL